MNLYKKIICVCVAILISNLAVAEEKTSKTYLDIFVVSMLSDVRSYILVLKLADDPNLKELVPIKDALSKKLFDIQIYLPEVNNREVVDLVCESLNKMGAEILSLSSNCTDDFCMESGRLNRMCALDKRWKKTSP